ncbi:probable L-type lectin-domain containing receptor kinase S.5 [Magnolia sinica]|uniref:probable L-type lectin-domain containing receptor kinase S.5 n=1 Tax=Magnolia sinica TaxID=86752 RepID=UPI002657AC75|nr:probable L-type lectin-domain containing receptor kinase S.5 [Magnolia sinica]
MFYLNQFQSFPPAFMKTLWLLLFLGFLIHVSCLNFSYSTMEDNSRLDFLYANGSDLAGGALQITRDSRNSNFPSQNLSGRVVYKDLFKLWRENGSVASFNTSFILNIFPTMGTGGEGLAFILTNNMTLPSNSDGQWLGIVNRESNGSSMNHIVAVEFDTRKSYIEDVDGNHVGVDVNSIYSIIQIPLGQYNVNLSSGQDVRSTIKYDGELKIMTVWVSMLNDTTRNQSNPVISWPIDLSQHLLEEVYVGFSASTGEYTQLNCIKSWNFISNDIGKDDEKQLLWILVVIPLAFIFCGGVLCYHRRRVKIASIEKNHTGQSLESMLTDSTTGARRFQLKELRSATENFDDKNKLGEGGFGKVYKGFLKKTNEMVAVKRISKESDQGEQEFVAEVMTIGFLNHKNLVRLIGWCCEKKELLLVYEFLPKGSLHKLIFSNESSSEEELESNWERRHKIIHGVASALSFLHDGCRRTTLHRDVKTSNVMLDSDYTARLGDFGLARMIQHDGITHHTTKAVAGTWGYIAPEYALTRRASKETDVYGFGVLCMVVACGRRPVCDHNLQNHNSNDHNNDGVNIEVENNNNDDGDGDDDENGNYSNDNSVIININNNNNNRAGNHNNDNITITGDIHSNNNNYNITIIDSGDNHRNHNGCNDDDDDGGGNNNSDGDDRIRNPNNNNINVADGDNSNNTTIVDWLWASYGRGRVLEAADRRLRGKFDKEQMGHVLRLGLACCHPNPNERPSMREAVQVLTGEALAPEPPKVKPAFMWPVHCALVPLEEISTTGAGYVDG